MVSTPLATPNFACMTLTAGARQLVVQDALDTMWCFAGSYCPSLTPMTTVRSSSLDGAVMMTFLAPASRCWAAVGPVRKMPVDSTTMSTSQAFQGMSLGSRWAKLLISHSPPTRMVSASARTSGAKRP